MKTKNLFQKTIFLSIILLITVYCSLIPAQAQGPIMRFPDIHDGQIVFVHGGDIWSVAEEGGVATRLTVNDGGEVLPKFSPDGSLIAFTGNYDGNPDVYVMNKYGGEITRVTFYPSYDEVVGWHPTKNKIIFRSSRNGYPRYSRLYLINPDGTGMEDIILHEVSQGSFSPDGKKIAFNKVSRENRTWKRYKGGKAQEIYLYDLETDQETNLTNFPGTDRIPMWIDDKIYFSSDRDRVLNIYSVDPGTGDIVQLTHHTEYDVRRPSFGQNKIVYELGGKLMVLNINTGEPKKVPVEIKADMPETRPYLREVTDYIQGFDCSPEGERALIVARGEIFTVPAEEGTTRNLTNTPGAREKDATWSPDGKFIAYLSDKSGEYQIYIIDQMGKEDAVELTGFKDGYRHSLRWSPDGKKIAFTDQNLTLYTLDVETKKITTIDKALYENIDVSIDVKPIFDYAWSPDSRYIAYSKMDQDLVNKIYIYKLGDARDIHCISTLFNDFHPAFSKDGKHLFFVSNRRFSPTFCDFEWEMVYKKTSGIYCLTLQADDNPLLPTESDEVKTGETEEKETVEMSEDVVIDFEGLENRIEALPLKRGNYRYLAANDNGVFYLNKDEGDFNRFEFRAVNTMDLYRFSFDDRKEQKVIAGVNSYKLSSGGNKIVYKKGENIGIIDASATDSKGEDLDLSNMKMWMDPLAEWKQIFNEAWRMERDYYYEPDMHGLDWDDMKIKYGKLMDYASCRQDVQFIIGELIGELSTSHTYVYGGDRKRKADRINTGLLGAEYMIDEENNLYQFKKILRVEDWSRGIYPPLNKPGIDVKEGDYILKVNEEVINANKNIYSYFQNLSGQVVTITVNENPTFEGAKEYTIKPISNEMILVYQDWVESNRLIVDRESGGKIGYMHFPDTYLGSATEFPKYFYSQARKKGLIIDGRFNGGGLDPDIFFSRLLKKPHSYWTRRYSHDQTSPAYGINAHMACITNRQAGSGGDELPQEFQQFNMGPVIGTRTWGGLVGVSMFIPMIDGGGLTAPDYRIYSPEGKWIVENEGITPDIIVELKPKEVAEGYDAQLMKAVEVLLKKIKEEPRPWPKHEPFPVDD